MTPAVERISIFYPLPSIHRVVAAFASHRNVPISHHQHIGEFLADVKSSKPTAILSDLFIPKVCLDTLENILTTSGNEHVRMIFIAKKMPRATDRNRLGNLPQVQVV